MPIILVLAKGWGYYLWEMSVLDNQASNPVYKLAGKVGDADYRSDCLRVLRSFGRPGSRSGARSGYVRPGYIAGLLQRQWFVSDNIARLCLSSW